MHEIRLEAALDLLIGLLVIGEEGDRRRLTVFADIGLVELGHLVAAPVEDLQVFGGLSPPGEDGYGNQADAERCELLGKTPAGRIGRPIKLTNHVFTSLASRAYPSLMRIVATSQNSTQKRFPKSIFERVRQNDRLLSVSRGEQQRWTAI